MWKFLQEGMIDKQLDRKISTPTLPDDSAMMKFFLKAYEDFTNAVRGYGGCDVYADKIAKWNKKKLMSLYIGIAEPMRCGFQVLNHGDTWVNNMMFKFDEDYNPIDVSMIDYQLSFWGTPSADILYFMTTSVADDIKVAHFDDLVEFYREQLISALMKLNYGQHIPSLSELTTDLLERGSFGMWSC